MKCRFALLVLMLFFMHSAHARDSHEQEKIDYLISSIAHLNGATFIRNGSEYNAEKAAEHLRQKLDYAGEKINTAREFIDNCATASWLSHRKYRIRFSDGHTQDSATYLYGRLKEYELSRPPEKPRVRVAHPLSSP
ncbi:MAG TPA: DUF5329 family protein [Arenimonas sp.]|nr:DUF5329 family protein [Arenimonas sp.]